MKIGLILKYLDEEYQASIYRSARRTAERLGHDLICIQGDLPANFGSPDVPVFPVCGILPLDGILLVSSLILNHRLPALSGALSTAFASVPSVMIGIGIDGFPAVCVDSGAALDRLLAHVLDFHGYRRILYLGGPSANLENAARERHIAREFDRAERLAADCSLKIMNGDLFGENAGMNLIREYTRLNPGRNIDLIMAGSDDMANGIRKYLRSCPLASWKYCPITGFDDIPESALSLNGLTTIHQPLEELGAGAVALLLDLARKKAVPPRIDIPASLQIRSSCGCAAGPETDAASSPEGSEFREQRLRDLGYFGQQLTGITDLRDAVTSLTEFLVCVNVKRFSLIGFPDPGEHLPGSGTLLYEFSVSSEGEASLLSAPVDLREYFNTFSGGSGTGAKSYCVLHLRSGPEYMGLIAYSADDDSHSYVSGCGMFLAHTLKRLQVQARDQARAGELEAEVGRRTVELERESRRRIEVEEEVLKIGDLERMRFSLDLHDDICQRLAAMAMISRNYAKDDPRMAMLAEMSAETLKRTRQYAHNSFPVELESMDLKGALEQLCLELDGQKKCNVLFDCAADVDSSLLPKQKISVYRIVQEALQNALAHSGGTSCLVELVRYGRTLAVRIQDNGTGNAEMAGRPVTVKNRRRPQGLGLRSMEYRAHQLGGEFRMVSSAEGGTLVEVLVPVRGDEA